MLSKIFNEFVLVFNDFEFAFDEFKLTFNEFEFAFNEFEFNDWINFLQSNDDCDLHYLLCCWSD